MELSTEVGFGGSKTGFLPIFLSTSSCLSKNSRPSYYPILVSEILLKSIFIFEMLGVAVVVSSSFPLVSGVVNNCCETIITPLIFNFFLEIDCFDTGGKSLQYDLLLKNTCAVISEGRIKIK